jgi:hypothetical protein
MRSFGFSFSNGFDKAVGLVATDFDLSSLRKNTAQILLRHRTPTYGTTESSLFEFRQQTQIG